MHLCMKNVVKLIFLVVTIAACQSRPTDVLNADDVNSGAIEFDRAEVKFAEGFTLYYGNNYKWICVKRPYPGAVGPVNYLLLPYGVTAPDSVAASQVIRIPVTRLVSTSTTHLPALDMLKESEALLGFANIDYISSPLQLQRAKAGKLTDIGRQQGLNMEKLIALAPQLVMTYSMGAADESVQSLKRSGLSIVLNADFLESSPLGRAEWIKFTAAFFNKEKEADSIFNSIEKEYNRLKAKVEHKNERPSVFSGVVYGDTWYVPGGQSWAARFLQDAGASYLWADMETAGSVPTSFEEVYARASDADYWVNAADYQSLTALKNADERYTNFLAWQKGAVYTYTNQQNEAGANAYLELGYARPDIVLADLIAILHPEILPDYELYFYKKLE